MGNRQTDIIKTSDSQLSLVARLRLINLRDKLSKFTLTNPHLFLFVSIHLKIQCVHENVALGFYFILFIHHTIALETVANRSQRIKAILNSL